jgi:hypothetical protein
MLYLDLYEKLILEDAIVDILDVKEPQGKNPLAKVEVGDTEIKIPMVGDNTTVGKFRDLLNNALRKSSDPDLENWKGGQITLGGDLKNKENESLKSIFPTFPEPIEFILRPGELQKGVDPTDTPHELWVNDKSAMRK